MVVLFLLILDVVREIYNKKPNVSNLPVKKDKEPFKSSLDVFKTNLDEHILNLTIMESFRTFNLGEKQKINNFIEVISNRLFI